MQEDNELKKIKAYRLAINKYLTKPIYQRIEHSVSCLIIVLQIISAFNLFSTYQSMNTIHLSLCFITAYFITDLVNGLVHMYMDNNTEYNSWMGPFVASFHLHHAQPRYINKPLMKIYFFESGTKFWLLLYLIVLCVVQIKVQLPAALNLILVLIAILSSIAELSHYLAHNTNNHRIIKYLQKYHFLLSMKHHSAHHLQDNINYAFLNGFSDPLLNFIARYFYKGYKNNADRHTRAYTESHNKKY